MPKDRSQATPVFSLRNVWLVFPWGQLILFQCFSRAGERTSHSPANYLEMCFILEQEWEALSCRWARATTGAVTDVEQLVITALAGDISAPGLRMSTERSSSPFWSVEMWKIHSLKDKEKVVLCLAAGKALPASSWKGLCSDTAVTKVQLFSAFCVCLPPSERMRRIITASLRFFVPTLSRSQLPPGLIQHLVVLETPKRGRETGKKCSCFLCLK